MRHPLRSQLCVTMVLGKKEPRVEKKDFCPTMLLVSAKVLLFQIKCGFSELTFRIVLTTLYSIYADGSYSLFSVGLL